MFQAGLNVAPGMESKSLPGDPGTGGGIAACRCITLTSLKEIEHAYTHW
jgi:hypothetical protein